MSKRAAPQACLRYDVILLQFEVVRQTSQHKTDLHNKASPPKPTTVSFGLRHTRTNSLRQNRAVHAIAFAIAFANHSAHQQTCRTKCRGTAACRNALKALRPTSEDSQN